MKSNSTMLYEFMESMIWEDMKEEIGEWLDEVRSLLEVENDDKEMWRHQGRAEALRELMLIPERMYEAKKIEEEEVRNGS